MTEHETPHRDEMSVPQSPGFVVNAVPSMITAIRLLLLPVVIAMVNAKVSPVLICVTLGVMGITDFLDGYVARKIGAVTTFGKVFDPTSDRIVVIVVAMDFTYKHIIPLGLAVPLLLREAIVSLIVAYLLGAYKKRVDVVWIGKAGTFALLTALPFLIFHQEAGTPSHDIYLAGLVIGTVGTAALYLAGYDYIKELLSARQKAKRARINEEGEQR